MPCVLNWPITYLSWSKTTRGKCGTKINFEIGGRGVIGSCSNWSNASYDLFSFFSSFLAFSCWHIGTDEPNSSNRVNAWLHTQEKWASRQSECLASVEHKQVASYSHHALKSFDYYFSERHGSWRKWVMKPPHRPLNLWYGWATGELFLFILITSD